MATLFLKMFSGKILTAVLLSFATLASSHCTYLSLLIANGAVTPAWSDVRQTNNFQSNAPVTDVTSADLATVAAGSTIGIQASQAVYHPGVINVYMAKAPSGTDVSTWDGSGSVWFKVTYLPYLLSTPLTNVLVVQVYQISAVTDGGTSITFPAQSKMPVFFFGDQMKLILFRAASYSFALPKSLPSGQYLVRLEQIAIHAASTFGGAQFYLSCAQINVTGGGSGTPGPLVAIPGVYTGNEPGILIDIYYPIPTTYVQPGPAVWSG
ncbi:glycosyl hydrolase family 61-domain-containing protein [Pholiota molesta]|nr:glycosyl hydrolase family 61-domain-containing protein [Pholiota molesta]